MHIEGHRSDQSVGKKEIESRWKVDGEYKDGTLILDDDITLEMEAIKPWDYSSPISPYFHGEDKKNGRGITLFEVIKKDHDIKKKKEIEIFKAKMAVLGGKFKNKKFERLEVQYCPCVWYSFIMGLDHPDEFFELKDYNFTCEVDDARLRIYARDTGDPLIGAELSVSVEPREPKDFRACLDYIGTLERVLSLIFCEFLTPQEIEGKIENKEVEVYSALSKKPIHKKKKRFEEIRPKGMVENFRKDKFQRILEKVEKDFEKFKGISFLYFWPMYFDDSKLEFLIYATALEGYCKNFHDSQVTLYRTLEIIQEKYLDLFIPENEEGSKAIDKLQKIIGNTDNSNEFKSVFGEFFECVRITRNWIAHAFYPKGQEDKIIHEPRHLNYANQVLRMILRLLLLHQLCFEKEEIRNYRNCEYYVLNRLEIF